MDIIYTILILNKNVYIYIINQSIRIFYILLENIDLINVIEAFKNT
jgi:hypothetical protein